VTGTRLQSNPLLGLGDYKRNISPRVLFRHHQHFDWLGICGSIKNKTLPHTWFMIVDCLRRIPDCADLILRFFPKDLSRFQTFFLADMA